MIGRNFNLGVKLVNVLMVRPGRRKVASSMNHENWEEVYRLAVLEVDRRKMPERISAAREAIAGKLREMQDECKHREERDRLEHVMDALETLRAESEMWP
jgi:hypothetical protein